ncbi:MAG: prepilin peptidase [Anaeromicrobium sp.]|jgi:prepilin peptidase CpaA|uniref:A24 family peptidase n=1 Tax=Anaeromicrobium sp. TaxID=1929132 RepID=UPI0025D2DAC4|nr:prepilin peptidase [Anaeromicrobium sp.]MCT4595108.1 prepilin peptidase [Anaeromicrobium sp.]
MWFDFLMIIILIICVITDIRERRIYNKIIFPGLIIGFLSHGLLAGPKSLYSSFIGFLLGFSILLIPYLLGGMGAGDVKLLALVGALKGPSFVFHTSIYMALIGGLIAIILLIFQKRLHTTLKSFYYHICSLKYGIKPHSLISTNDLSNTYPYGTAIAAGALINLLLERGFVLW